MDVSKLMLTAETFVVIREDEHIIIFGFFYNVLFLRENEFTQSKQIHLKNVDLKMKYEDMKIELENILGGGFVGDMANEVLTLIGQDFIFAHKDTLANATRMGFQTIMGRMIDLDDLKKKAEEYEEYEDEDEENIGS